MGGKGFQARTRSRSNRKGIDRGEREERGKRWFETETLRLTSGNSSRGSQQATLGGKVGGRKGFGGRYRLYRRVDGLA